MNAITRHSGRTRHKRITPFVLFSMPKRVLAMVICIAVCGLDLILQGVLFAVYGHVTPYGRVPSWSIAVPAAGVIAGIVNLASRRRRP